MIGTFNMNRSIKYNVFKLFIYVLFVICIEVFTRECGQHTFGSTTKVRVNVLFLLCLLFTYIVSSGKISHVNIFQQITIFLLYFIVEFYSVESIACKLILTQHVKAANVSHPEISLFLIIYPRLLFQPNIISQTRSCIFFKSMFTNYCLNFTCKIWLE